MPGSGPKVPGLQERWLRPAHQLPCWSPCVPDRIRFSGLVAAGLKTPSEVASFLPLPVVESPLPCPKRLEISSQITHLHQFLAQMDQCQLLDKPTLRHPPPTPSVSLKLALFTSLNRFHFPLKLLFILKLSAKLGVSSLQMMCSIQGMQILKSLCDSKALPLVDWNLFY